MSSRQLRSRKRRSPPASSSSSSSPSSPPTKRSRRSSSPPKKAPIDERLSILKRVEHHLHKLAQQYGTDPGDAEKAVRCRLNDFVASALIDIGQEFSYRREPFEGFTPRPLDQLHILEARVHIERRLHEDAEYSLNEALRDGYPVTTLWHTEALIEAGADPSAFQSRCLDAPARAGDADRCRLLMSKGADPRCRHWKPFLRALKSDHPDLAQMMLDHPAYAFDYLSKDCARAIVVTMRKKQSNVCRLLLEGKCQGRGPQYSYLYMAARCGSDDICQYLLGKGLDAQHDHSEALRLAAKMGRLSTCKLLYRNGARVKDSNSSRMLLAAVRGDHADVCRWLVEQYEGREGPDPRASGLRATIKRGQRSCFDLLLGAIDYSDEYLKDALCNTVFFARYDMCRHFIKSWSSDRLSGFQCTLGHGLLYWAALSGRLDMCRMLIQAGCRPADDGLALVVATRNRYVDMCRLLLDHGAPIHYEDDEALRHSLSDDSPDTFNLLIERGADPSSRGGDLICVACQIHVSKTIFDRVLGLHTGSVDGDGNDVDPVCRYPQDKLDWALCQAVESGSVYKFRRLLEVGAQIQTHKGQMVVAIADIKHQEIASYFVDHMDYDYLVTLTESNRRWWRNEIQRCGYHRLFVQPNDGDDDDDEMSD